MQTEEKLAGRRSVGLAMRGWLLTLIAMAGISIAGIASRPAWSKPPSDPDHVVGTLQQVDTKYHRLVIGLDAQTGDELGQGAPVNVYFDDTTTVQNASGTAKITDLKMNDRLMIHTQTTGDKMHAIRVRVLADTDVGQGWGRYLHGTVRSLEPATNTMHVDQAQSDVLNRIGHDANTKVVTLDGKPSAVSNLKPGDEVDMSLLLREKVTTAKTIVVLRPAATP